MLSCSFAAELNAIQHEYNKPRKHNGSGMGRVPETQPKYLKKLTFNVWICRWMKDLFICYFVFLLNQNNKKLSNF